MSIGRLDVVQDYTRLVSASPLGFHAAFGLLTRWIVQGVRDGIIEPGRRREWRNGSGEIAAVGGFSSSHGQLSFQPIHSSVVL